MMLRSSLPQGDAAVPRLLRRPRLGTEIRRIALPLLAFALGTALVGCVDDADDTDGLPYTPPSDTPVATRYGAIGNSLTAGFINGGLIEGGQLASYPRVIAAQAGWDTPQIPQIASPGIGSTPGQSALYITPTGTISAKPVPNPLVLLANATLPRPYDNLGVPGATTKDLLDAVNSGTSQSGNNPFFDLILRNSALPPFGQPRTVLDQMEDRNPNALTVWIGNNDILGGALGGNPVVGGNITPPEAWQLLFSGVVARLDAMNAEYVAIANIPNIVDIPYVTTIPPALGPGVSFNTDEDDVAYVLLPFALLAASNPDTLGTFIGALGGTNSLPSNWTLTADEATTITQTAAAYNQVIQSACAARGWAYVDISTELAALPKNPLDRQLDVVNGFFPLVPEISTHAVALLPNPLSAFSLDGVHPSEIGSALVANAFIRAFNSEYNLDITEKDLSTVHNVTGFEEAPFGRPFGSTPGSLGTSHFAASQDALTAIETLPTLFGIAQ